MIIRAADSTSDGVPPRTLLALAVFHGSGERGASLADLRRSLTPYLSRRHSKGEIAELLRAELEACTTRGWIEPVSGSRSRHGLTGPGRARLGAELELEAAVPRLSFARLRDGVLVAHALGLPRPSVAEEKRLRSADGLRAVILDRSERLDVGPYPTLVEVRNALAWRELSTAFDRPLTDAERRAKLQGEALLAFVLGGLLDDSRRRAVKSLLALLAARAVGATKVDAAELRRAILRGWIDEASRGSDVESASPDASVKSPPELRAPGDADLSRFAERVLDAARSCTPWQPGAGKVFISDVWNTFRSRGDASDLSESEFKTRLVEANHSRLLDLARADLVGVMNPSRVKPSETEYLGATFHFVCTDPVDPGESS